MFFVIIKGQSLIKDILYHILQSHKEVICHDQLIVTLTTLGQLFTDTHENVKFDLCELLTHVINLDTHQVYTVYIVHEMPFIIVHYSRMKLFTHLYNL